MWHHSFGALILGPVRILVFWCMILDTFHTAVTVFMLWDYTVANFGKYEIYKSLPWAYSTTPIYSEFASLFPPPIPG